MARESLGGADDLALLDAWRGGDRDAGALLFDRYFPAIARFFRNKVDDFEDLVQATFLAAAEGRDRIHDASRFRSYLFSIAHNLLRKHFTAMAAARREIDLAEVSVHDLLPSPSELVERKAERRLLLAALRRIPFDDQVVLELFYFEPMKAADIGDVLALPEGTVRTRLRSARKRLEVRLRELTRRPGLFESTLTELEDWARDMRTQAVT